MIPYIIDVVVGFVIAKLTEGKSKPKESSKSSKKTGYLVYIRTEKFNKSYLEINDYDKANNLFEKIAKEKKISYKTIVDNDPEEAKLYQKWKNEDVKDAPKLTDSDKVFYVALEDSNGNIIKEKKTK